MVNKEVLQVIKEKYIIDIRPKPNKYYNMSENSLTKEEYNLLKKKKKND